MKTIQARTKFLDEPAVLRWGKYANGQNALQLYGITNEPLMIASVCMPKEIIAPDQIFIKDWSENVGILQCLITEGIVRDMGKRVPAGYTTAALCVIVGFEEEDQ